MTVCETIGCNTEATTRVDNYELCPRCAEEWQAITGPHSPSLIERFTNALRRRRDPEPPDWVNRGDFE